MKCFWQQGVRSKKEGDITKHWFGESKVLDRNAEFGVQYESFCEFEVSESGEGVLRVRAGGAFWAVSEKNGRFRKTKKGEIWKSWDVLLDSRQTEEYN